MRTVAWVGVGLVAGTVLYVALKVKETGSLADAASSITNDVSQGVLNVFYTVNGDSRANEELYAPLITEAEARHGIPDGLLHRQLYQESRYRSDIIGVYPDGTPVPAESRTVSGAGAEGIAQIVPRWHPGVDPWNPPASIEYAASYMEKLHAQFGSWQAALAAYNWGPGNVGNLIAHAGGLDLAALPSETRNYVTDITSDVGVA